MEELVHRGRCSVRLRIVAFPAAPSYVPDSRTQISLQLPFHSGATSSFSFAVKKLYEALARGRSSSNALKPSPALETRIFLDDTLIHRLLRSCNTITNCQKLNPVPASYMHVTSASFNPPYT
ncbi:hypothetical protein FHG87_007336 [Trinorchestia longiramus]|nr:hypothetical protein FHG87_007336 [Trinorchestia longiramus]